MDIQSPPPNTDPALRDYLFRQFKIVENEIFSVNGVSVVGVLPERPRDGKIYYLKEGTDNSAGYWVWLNNVWVELGATGASYNIEPIVSALRRRCLNAL